VARYESGELKTVSEKIFEYAQNLEKRTRKAVETGSRHEMEKIKEEIYGEREGLVLFSEVEEELQFLKKQGGLSPKKYLGRSISHYQKSTLKRIATWRARKIREDCEALIQDKPEIRLKDLPRHFQTRAFFKIIKAFRSYLLKKILESENRIYEKRILTPSSHFREEYENETNGFTTMASAAQFLGMSPKAFDLMVAANSEIFRKINMYDEKWYIPDLYLKELMLKSGFTVIKAKYELLVQKNEQKRYVKNHFTALGHQPKRDRPKTAPVEEKHGHQNPSQSAYAAESHLPFS
jgi:hypothetical protein